jgi:hypothetical protein
MNPKLIQAYIHKYGALHGKRWGQKVGLAPTNSLHCTGQPIPPPGPNSPGAVETLQELEDAIAQGAVHPSVQDELRRIYRGPEVARLQKEQRVTLVLEALRAEAGPEAEDAALEDLAPFLVQRGLVHRAVQFLRPLAGWDDASLHRLEIRLERLQDGPNHAEN